MKKKNYLKLNKRKKLFFQLSRFEQYNKLLLSYDVSTRIQIMIILKVVNYLKNGNTISLVI